MNVYYETDPAQARLNEVAADLAADLWAWKAEALAAAGYEPDMFTPGTEWVDPTVRLELGNRSIVRVVDVWPLTSGWSATVRRRQVDEDGQPVEGEGPEGVKDLDYLLAVGDLTEPRGRLLADHADGVHVRLPGEIVCFVRQVTRQGLTYARGVFLTGDRRIPYEVAPPVYEHCGGLLAEGDQVVFDAQVDRRPNVALLRVRDVTAGTR